MKLNKIIYPECPDCKVLLNDMSLFPMNLLFVYHPEVVECPKCHGQFEVSSRIELTLKVEEYEIN